MLPDKSKALFVAFSSHSQHWSNLAPRLRLAGLDPAATYEVNEPLPNNKVVNPELLIKEVEEPQFLFGSAAVRVQGATLMKAGVPLLFFAVEDAAMLLLTRVR